MPSFHMKVFRLLTLPSLMLAAAGPATAQVYLDASQPIETRVDDLLSRLTL